MGVNVDQPGEDAVPGKPDRIDPGVGGFDQGMDPAVLDDESSPLHHLAPHGVEDAVGHEGLSDHR